MGYNVLEELSAEQRKFAAESSNLSFKSDVLDISENFAEANYLFRINGQDTLPTGELAAIKAKSKQGKSQVAYYLAAILLGRISKGDIKPLKDDAKVLICDTEQSKASLKKCVCRALRFAGLSDKENCSRLTPLFLRPRSIEERKQRIEEAIKELKPTLVVIDGIRDLMQDFNNLAESSDLIGGLLKTASENDVCIINILHMNKAATDSNMRGHAGTELANKLCDCLQVEKKDGVFRVVCDSSRNLPFEPFAFSINGEGDFQPEEKPDDNKDAERAAEIQRVLKLCFENRSEYGYNELAREYALQAAQSERTAKRKIEIAKANDFISVSGDKYKLTSPPV